MSFEQLGLSPEIMRAIVDQGYTEPTPIQKQAIPPVLEGKDIMGSAQTHPEDLVTHRFSLDDVDKAYDLMNEGRCGKVAVCFDEELERESSGADLAAGEEKCSCC